MFGDKDKLFLSGGGRDVSIRGSTWMDGETIHAVLSETLFTGASRMICGSTFYLPGHA